MLVHIHAGFGLALCIVVTGLVHAQRAPVSAPVSDRVREQARQEFALGLAATEAQNWTSAHDHMRRARELNPTSLRILSGLAVAQTNAGLLLEARESYRTWMVEGADQPVEARLAIQRQLDDVEHDVPQLTLRLNGMLAGDALVVDGRIQEMRGEPLRLNPGRHELTITREGRVVSRGFVEMGVGARANYELTAPPRVGDSGTLHINTNVAADVYLNGVLLGRAPADFPVTAGRHALELRTPGFVPLLRNVDVSVQQVVDISVVLARADAHLRVTCGTPGAIAFIDGRVLGPVPGEFDVGQGTHTLEVRSEGYTPFRRDVTFQSNETVLQDAALVQTDPSLRPIATPSGDNTVAWIVGLSVAAAIIGAGVGVYFGVIEPANREMPPFQGNLGDPVVLQP